MDDYFASTDNSTNSEKVYSVGEYIDFLNALIRPAEAFIQGEVVSVTERGQAVYFTLSDKDDKVVIHCLVWRNRLASMGIALKEGEEIKIQAFPQIYKPIGRLSLQAQYIIPVGEGALKAAFEKLKKELADSGYFAPERKRIIPKFVLNIGLITSEAADAKKDFITHLGKFGYTINFYDVRVEGVKAIPSICNAINYFNAHPGLSDVLVLTRGGGSLESLQAFNSLDIAKAIYSSRIPVISAIGHENDITIADLVSDLRASTPTDAGKILSNDWVNVHSTLGTIEKNIHAHFKKSWMNGMVKLKQVEADTIWMFANHIGKNKLAFQEGKSDYVLSAHKWLEFIQSKLVYADKLLDAFNPENKLKQGYSIVTDMKNVIIRDANAVALNDIIALKFYIGKLRSRVEKIE